MAREFGNYFAFPIVREEEERDVCERKMRTDSLPLEFKRASCYTQSMGLSSYIDAAAAAARYKILEDKTYYGEIPGFDGVWASAKSLKKCRVALREVLEDWIVLKLRSDEPLPPVRGKKLTVPELARA